MDMKRKQKNKTVKVGVSRCLLGEAVRWDGGHKREGCVQDVLGKVFTWVAVCPEVEAGMGVPRAPVSLVGNNNKTAPRLVENGAGRDWTPRMEKFIRCQWAAIEKLNLSGFIFKKNSPSCGIRHIPVYKTGGDIIYRRAGLFAGAFMKRFPGIPVEEEDKLRDAKIRDHFITRVLVCWRLGRSLCPGGSRRALAEFHARNAFLLLAHSRRHHAELNRLVANATTKRCKHSGLAVRYRTVFMEGLAYKSTPKKNAGVFLRLLGTLKIHLTPDEKKQCLKIIEEYRNGRTPWNVPADRLHCLARRFQVQSLLDQEYLNNPRL